MDKRFTKEYIEGLAHKFKTGSLTPEEQAYFDTWYQSYNDTEFAHSDSRDPELIKDRLLTNILAETHPVQKSKFATLWPRITAAASILLILSTGAYLILHKSAQPALTAENTINDIAPGKNTATLTLANGKKIILSDALKGQIAKQAGVSITKTSNGQVVYTIAENNIAETTQFNTLSTAKGETYKVNLPDGTQVWLNAASSLTYPASFESASIRKVTLTGEAYFEVAKDKAHPFEVATDKQTVTVLGTHFNINAYNDEEAVKTTLMEGSVQVAAEGRGAIKIKPGEQASLEGTSINVSNADIEKVIAWKEGDFIFKDEGLQTAMLRVARWYNVDVIYDASAPKNLELGGWVSRSKNISAVLKMMASTGKVHFKVQGRRITVSK